MAPLTPEEMRWYNLTATQTTSVLYSTGRYVSTEAPEETKKERIARIAKEKMHASWDLHDKKTPTIKQQIQICKPHHRMLAIGTRKR